MKRNNKKRSSREPLLFARKNNFRMIPGSSKIDIGLARGVVCNPTI
jgi:hypothetical protein